MTVPARLPLVALLTALLVPATASADDTTPPTGVQITAPASGAVVSPAALGTPSGPGGLVPPPPNPMVTAAASDDVGVTRIELYADGATTPPASPPTAEGWKVWTFDPPTGQVRASVVTRPPGGPVFADGTVTLRARAFDAAGNSALSPPIQLVVDTVAPDLTVTSPTVPSAYTPGGVTVIVNAAGGPDAVELATSADTTWCEVLSGATSQGASLAPEGCARTGTTIRIPLAARARDDLYRFRVFATDAAGNATDRLVEALLDVTAPIASLVAVSRPDLPPGAIEAALTRPSFPSPGCPSTGGSFNPCFEQVAEQAYELDGGPETPFVPGPRGQYLRLLGLAPGPHTLRVRVTDLAGNTRWLDPVTLTVPAPGGGTTTPAAAPSFPPAPASTTAAGVATTVACAEACAITTSGTVTVPGAARVYRLATRTTRLTRAGRVTIRTPVPKAARAAVRRAIRQGRRVEARVRVQVRTSSGTTRTKTQRVRLRR